MLQKNAELILGHKLSETDKVLDIGGWVQPFNRADYVVDILPYETRGIHGNIGPGPERFSKKTWILHDVCGSAPLPFLDKEFDYVICSHVLEDIRDPVRLCREMIRVGKAGYIEVPSRTLESVMGLEGRNYAGYYHHRWLIDITGTGITFRHKTHLLHESWRLHLPKSYLAQMHEDGRVAFLFWEGTFQYREVIQISMPEVQKELEGFVQRTGAYSKFRYTSDALLANLCHPKDALKVLMSKSPFLLSLAERILGRKVILEQPRSKWLDTPEIESR